MTDLGREFQGAFEIGAEMDATYIEPSALEMPTQRSITERAGKQFKEVLSKTMMQYACQKRVRVDGADRHHHDDLQPLGQQVRL